MALAISIKKGEKFSIGSHVLTLSDYAGSDWAELQLDGAFLRVIQLDSQTWDESIPEVAMQLSHKEKPGFCRILIDAPKFEVLRDNYKDGR